jgi:hypothetical protein
MTARAGHFLYSYARWFLALAAKNIMDFTSYANDTNFQEM